MALQFAMVAMGAALRGTGNFKPGMIVQTATVIINMVLAPFLIFGWGTGRPLGVAGAAISSLIAVAVGTVWLATLLPSRRTRTCIRRGGLEAATSTLWKRMLIDRSARRRRVRADGGVSADRLCGEPAVRRGGAGRFRHRHAHHPGLFMPVVALGFAVAPVAGQNFGARLPDRVRATFKVPR